jgi:hypothetical protein
MVSKWRKTPSVLLLILSALGILFGAVITAIILADAVFLKSRNGSIPNYLSVITTCVLSLTICILNIPTFISSLKCLKQKASKHPLPSLFKTSNYLMLFWPVIMLAGYMLSQNETTAIFLPPITIISIAVPIWWLVEFSRKGLPRSTMLREWGTLSLGITFTPVLIILIELIVVALTIITVMIGLGFQEDFNFHFRSFLNNKTTYQSGISQLEQILYGLMKFPIVSSGLFIVVGILAPLIEEFFKPVIIWFLVNRPLKDYEGFSLGLISGGAFTLLESSGMVIQLNARDWLIAVLLRAATGVLHIGLSGFVGFGMTRNWNQKKYGKGVLFFLIAVLLHGCWNSLALLSGFSSALPQTITAFSHPEHIDKFILGAMVGIFLIIITITLKINTFLRHQSTAHEN